MPFLSHLYFPPFEWDAYPCHIPTFKSGLSINLTSNVAFFAGKNGYGKSILLESMAEKIGFSLRDKNHNLNTAVNFEGYEIQLAQSTSNGLDT